MVAMEAVVEAVVVAAVAELPAVAMSLYWQEALSQTQAPFAQMEVVVDLAVPLPEMATAVPAVMVVPDRYKDQPRLLHLFVRVRSLPC
jgi:hypothetical protein